MLSDLDRMVLQFEGLHWKHLGKKEGEIRRQFGWTAARYAQYLLALVDRPEAAAFAPATVRRVVEHRAQVRPHYPKP